MTNKETVTKFSNSIITYLEQDLQSYKHVLDNSELKGKLGVGMITNASAAIDIFAWLIGTSQFVGERFKSLLTDNRHFFGDPNNFSPDVVYKIIRCGTVHQFYPKAEVIITAIDSSDWFVNHEDNKCINAFGFYKTVTEGCKKIAYAIAQETDVNTIDSWADKLNDRVIEESPLTADLSNCDFIDLTCESIPTSGCL